MYLIQLVNSQFTISLTHLYDALSYDITMTSLIYMNIYRMFTEIIDVIVIVIYRTLLSDMQC